jgi:hypothetical protein
MCGLLIGALFTLPAMSQTPSRTPSTPEQLLHRVTSIGRTKWKLTSEPAGKETCSLKVMDEVVMDCGFPLTITDVSAISGLYSPLLVTVPSASAPARITVTPLT